MAIDPALELRYDDGPTTEAQTVIDAPPEVVWALVTDIDLPSRFSSEFLGARWVDTDGGPGPRLGRRFVGRNRHGAIGEWETTAVVVEYEPPRVFGWSIGEPDHPSATWRFTLGSEGGRTSLTQWVRIGPARSGINIAIDAMPEKESRILHRRMEELRSNMEATVRGVKDLAEQAPGR